MQWRHTVWPEAKLVYSAVAKVANTSIKTALLHSFMPDVSRKNPHSSEIPYATVRPERLQERYADYLHFAVVRNPWDRFVSFYEDKIIGANYYPKLNQVGFREGMSFAEAARVACATPDNEADPHMRSQSFLLLDEKGALRPDLVLRFERLASDWELLSMLVEARTGSKLRDLPNRKKSNRQVSTSNYYDDETAALIEERYATDFVSLGYAVDQESPASKSTPPQAGEVAEKPASVLDLSAPSNVWRKITTEPASRYLGLWAASPVGQLVNQEILWDGRVDLSAFDRLIVGSHDSDVHSYNEVVLKFRELGRDVLIT